MTRVKIRPASSVELAENFAVRIARLDVQIGDPVQHERVCRAAQLLEKAACDFLEPREPRFSPLCPAHRPEA